MNVVEFAMQRKVRNKLVWMDLRRLDDLRASSQYIVKEN